MRAITGGPAIPNESIRAQLRELWHIHPDPQAKRRLAYLAATITFVIALNAGFQILLNNWQGNIYDAIGQKDVSIFLRQVEVFLLIVSVLLCLGVFQTWLHEMLKVRLREAITFDLVKEWLHEHRQYLLKQRADISTNPDQRIQDDAKRLSELSVDLAVGVVQSTLLLVAFIGVLWELSEGIVFSAYGKQFSVPGYMVWTALVYSAIGSTITLFVGKPLIKSHTQLRAREAEFRFALVRVSEYADDIALFGGEDVERNFVGGRVESLLWTMRRIANRLAGLTWVTGAYGWLAILAPLLLAAPGYFSGSLTLGGLMMVVGGFYQVQSALRWFVDKFSAIAEWRAMLGRVSSYRSALEEPCALPDKCEIIHHETGAPEISIEHLKVGWNGFTPLEVENFTVRPGERVLIEAMPKSGKSTFHKALAGLWSRGSGTICVPPRERIMFLPQLPYLPLGTLRAALAYPKPGTGFGKDEILAVVERVKLGYYAKELDEEKRWDKELTLDERRRVILARVLLHKPEWIVQDESIYELDEESRRVAESIFGSELKGTAVLSIGRRAVYTKDEENRKIEPKEKADPFYDRIVDGRPKNRR